MPAQTSQAKVHLHPTPSSEGQGDLRLLPTSGCDRCPTPPLPSDVREKAKWALETSISSRGKRQHVLLMSPTSWHGVRKNLVDPHSHPTKQ